MIYSIYTSDCLLRKSESKGESCNFRKRRKKKPCGPQQQQGVHTHRLRKPWNSSQKTANESAQTTTISHGSIVNFIKYRIHISDVLQLALKKLDRYS